MNWWPWIPNSFVQRGINQWSGQPVGKMCNEIPLREHITSLVNFKDNLLLSLNPFHDVVEWNNVGRPRPAALSMRFLRMPSILRYTFISMWWTTSTALHLEPAPPLTVPVNQPQIFTWIRDDDDDDVPSSVTAIAVNSSPTQSSKDNEDFVGSRMFAPADIRFRLLIHLGGGDDEDDEDDKPRNGTVTLTFPSATSFSIVAKKGKPPGQKVLHTFSGTVVATVSTGTTSTTASTTTQAQSASSTNTALSTPGSSSSASSTVNGPAQAGTPTSTGATTETSVISTSSALTSPVSTIPLGTAVKTGENNKAVILGCALGGSMFILVSLLLLFAWRQRRHRKGRSRDTMSRTSSIMFYRDEMVRAIARRLTFRKEDPTEDTSSSTATFTGSFKEKQARNSMSLAGLDVLEKHDVNPLAPTEPKDAFWARTDRQMEIEQKIIELQSRLISASPLEKDWIMDRVKKLKELRNSDWAYGRDGAEVPEVMRGWNSVP
ncbi:hypothetical protein E1B28_013117 [Marasmius oreades]|uniref:Uncharacterized protein n=1 Tax=Marasmius oreades TaxID=181124 RepID=A0A9P7UNP3_9AGAR|nr:uncharacterized protein E1B28_013117 [Marasmius oreades]KAG7087136.1 hypothetical protein E1B28_013117 [Marasmius oreades]